MEQPVSDKMAQVLMEAADWTGTLREQPKFKVEETSEETETVNEGTEESAEETEVVSEETAEEHTCPLCESKLEEALSEETIDAHIDQIVESLIAEHITEDNDDEDESDD